VAAVGEEGAEVGELGWGEAEVGDEVEERVEEVADGGGEEGVAEGFGESALVLGDEDFVFLDEDALHFLVEGEGGLEFGELGIGGDNVARTNRNGWGWGGGGLAAGGAFFGADPGAEEGEVGIVAGPVGILAVGVECAAGDAEGGEGVWLFEAGDGDHGVGRWLIRI